MNPSAFLLMALSFVVLAHSRSYYHCQPCRGEECDVKPEGCMYGTFRDPCGWWQCMSGPDERCGGRDNHRGKCGSGMTCTCGSCRGCSEDMLDRGIPLCSKNANTLCY